MDLDFGRPSTTRDDSFHADRFDRSAAPPSHESRPFGAIKKLRVSPRIVARFVAGSLLSLKSHTGPRGTVRHVHPFCIALKKDKTISLQPDLATALQQSCIAWKKDMLHVEDLHTRLGQLPSSPSLSPSPSPSSTAYYGDQELLAGEPWFGAELRRRGLGAHALPERCVGSPRDIARDGAEAAWRGGAAQGVV